MTAQGRVSCQSTCEQDSKPPLDSATLPSNLLHEKKFLGTFSKLLQLALLCVQLGGLDLSCQEL